MSRSMVRVVARTWPWDRSLVWFFFSFVSTFFGVERGGLVVLVFLIYIPYLYCTSGMVGITSYMVGDSAVAPASSCRSGLPDLGLVF